MNVPTILAFIERRLKETDGVLTPKDYETIMQMWHELFCEADDMKQRLEDQKARLDAALERYLRTRKRITVETTYDDDMLNIENAVEEVVTETMNGVTSTMMLCMSFMLLLRVICLRMQKQSVYGRAYTLEAFSAYVEREAMRRFAALKIQPPAPVVDLPENR